jgi:GT2 family glycosyltransferase
MHPSVAVLILNWRGYADTARCLRSVLASDHPAVLPVVLDNASADGSFERLAAEFPGVAFVQTGANLGYGGGNNVGLRWALRAGADYAMVLNNDTQVPPECIGALVEAMEADPRIGQAGPKVMDATRGCIGCVGGAVHWPTAEPRQIGCLEQDRGQYREVADVEYVPGTAVMVRRAALEQVGPMDERYFLYFEDVAWSQAFRRAGWRTVAVPGAHLLHFESSTVGPESPMKLYYHVRNNLSFIGQWVAPGERRAVRRRFHVKLAGLAVRATLRRSLRQLRAIHAGYRDFHAGRMDRSERRF